MKKILFAIISILFLITSCAHIDDLDSGASKYKITFDKQGGTGGSDVVFAEIDQPMPIATAPVKKDYVFLGYYYDDIGIEIIYYTGNMTSMKNFDITKDIILHALWTEEKVADLLYSRRNDGYAVTSEMNTATNIIIPEYYKGLPVIIIDHNAFKGFPFLISITIPDTVNYIGVSAFENCINLVTINISKNIETIYDLAFEQCTSLVSINVGNDNQYFKSIDGVLFDKSASNLIKCPEGKTKNYKIPSSVNDINDYAFANCINLTSITISNDVLSIGNYAFYSCINITTITITKNITTILKNTFLNCNKLNAINVDQNNQYYKSIDGILFDKSGHQLIKYPENKSGSINISSEVFSIDTFAFTYCKNLISINVDQNNQYFISIDGVLFDIEVTSLIRCPEAKSGDYIIPNTVSNINHEAFYRCINLISITIHSNVRYIANGTFAYCSPELIIYLEGFSSYPSTWDTQWNYGVAETILIN